MGGGGWECGTCVETSHAQSTTNKPQQTKHRPWSVANSVLEPEGASTKDAFLSRYEHLTAMFHGG